MNKIIGLITAWGADKWIVPALEQALEYCDEVIAVVAAHSPVLKPFEDDTYNICKEFDGVKLLDIKTDKATVNVGRCEILNSMLKSSNLFEIGNWVWMLDVDEFYSNTAYEEIKQVINTGKYDEIKVEERFFFINMRNYLEASHRNRLLRIKSLNDKFVPTNRWTPSPKNIYTLKRNDGMFHYSMLTDTKVHEARWSSEYAGFAQDVKVKWLKSIYYSYDLNDEDYWIKVNSRLTGTKSPWFAKGFGSDKGGRLFKYDGKHPKFVKDLVEIEDFRGYYG